MKTRVLWLATLSLSVGAACGASMVQQHLDAEYGSETPRNREIAAPPEQGVDYWTDVRPVFEQRCVVCHGCYDSPCQLNLSAVEGIERGASKARVYEPSRIHQSDPTRLFEDAETPEEWRERGFFPVLNERANLGPANLEASVLFRMLALKEEHPLPSVRRLEGFDFRLDREQSCPTIEEFPKYESDHALGGMPYGLPALSEREASIIERWIEQGAVYAERPQLPETMRERVAQFERWINGDDLKSRLVARYLYEHLYLAHLHFEDADEGKTPTFFELVRSKTHAPHAVERVNARRPHDTPGVDRVYYRLVPLRTAVLDKTHLPYSLSEARLHKWRRWFVDAPFEVKELPGYSPELAANPFATFLQIPVGSRYRFLLDEARFTLDNFIKGPVCRGQTSLNVINDRFWVYFLDPENIDQAEAQFYAEQAPSLTLPPNDPSGVLVLARWNEYAKKEKRYLEAKSRFIKSTYGRRKPVNLGLLWRGDDQRSGGAGNQNVVLTVLRHEDSASVVQGMVGAPPKTSWVLGYGVLERIHYLLVADFDVFGNLSHQLVTRVYMDFLRMEAEANFVGFLPKDSRGAVVSKWYEGAEEETMPYIWGHSQDAPQTGLVFTSRNPELELYEKLDGRVGRATSQQWEVKDAEGHMQPWAQTLERLTGGGVQLLPQVSLLRVRAQTAEGAEQAEYFTLLRDNDHKNILSIFDEESRRRPELDRVTVVRGVIGAYPNALFQLDRDELEAFASQVALLKTEQDYDALRDRFGVRRTDVKFWEFSDLVHRELRDERGIEFGLLDYNRLENR